MIYEIFEALDLPKSPSAFINYDRNPAMQYFFRLIMNSSETLAKGFKDGVIGNLIYVCTVFIVYNFVVRLIAFVLFDQKVSWFFTLQSDFWRAALQFDIPLQGVGTLLVAGPISYYLVRVVPASFRIYSSPSISSPPVEQSIFEDFGRSPVIKSLERRIKESTNRASAIITIVIISLLAAVAIVIFAGRLTSIDANAVSASASLQNDIDNIDSRLKGVDNDLDGTLLSERGRAYLEKQIEFYTERRKQLSDLYELARKNELAHSTEDRFQNTGFFRAALLTRVSVLVVLVFLVKILLNLYRYHIQVATFYASRLDAVRLSSEDLKNLKAVSDFVTPEKIQFGSDPQHPLQEALSIFRGKERNRDTEKKS